MSTRPHGAGPDGERERLRRPRGMLVTAVRLRRGTGGTGPTGRYLGNARRALVDNAGRTARRPVDGHARQTPSIPARSADRNGAPDRHRARHHHGARGRDRPRLGLNANADDYLVEVHSAADAVTARLKIIDPSAGGALSTAAGAVRRDGSPPHRRRWRATHRAATERTSHRTFGS
jgi:hypothetical protein